MFTFPRISRIFAFNLVNLAQNSFKIQVKLVAHLHKVKMHSKPGVIYPNKAANQIPIRAGLVDEFKSERNATAKSILQFNFNMNRVRLISERKEVVKSSKGVLYWMSREMRVQDNWSLLFAQKLALENDLPLHICFCLLPKFLDATIRHYKFLLKGLQEVEQELKSLNIQFHLLFGESQQQVPLFVKENNIGGVVTDFSPLRSPRQWVEAVKNALPAEVPFYQVDGHNIVPVWVTSDRQEPTASQLRKKITSHLAVYLTNFPPVIRHPNDTQVKAIPINWDSALEKVDVDRTVDEVEWATPGYRAAIELLNSFCEKRLKLYQADRNNPTVNAISNLSPLLHFGQLAPARMILHVNKFKQRYPKDVEKFCDEAIVWRELTENFCFYNQNYDNMKGAESWAVETLTKHSKDKRKYVYTLKEFDEARTHDNLWNSAQIQMKKEGKMHCFMRMYWAKMILEWSESPEEALKIAIYLNDRYNLDGRDPNGFGGCMWSICGIHDRPFDERPIYGKIRFMTYEATKRKFDIFAYIRRYPNIAK